MRPLIKIKPPGPKARKIISEDSKIMSSSLGRAYPLAIKRTFGTNFEDADGNRFLDFNSGIAVMNFGYCNKKIETAIKNQLSKATHGAFLDFYEELPVKFSNELLKMLPKEFNLKRVFLSNSGAESVEAAIKLSRYHNRRKIMASFHGSFHGRTMGSLSLTASKAVYRDGFEPFLPAVHFPYANPYRCPLGADEDNCVDACLNYIDSIFKKETNPDEIAALFMEPVQGEGGYIVPPKEFVKAIEKICKGNGIIFVADEVQSGCYRTGKLLASEHFDIKPDVVCMSKALGGGLPLGATIFKDELNNWPPGSHASTFGGNLLACSAGMAVLDLMKDKKLGKEVLSKGNYIMKTLNDFKTTTKTLGDVRGLGLMIGLEFVKNNKTKETNKQIRNEIVYRCFEKGLSLLGASESVIRIAPPLIISEEDIDTGLEILMQTIKEVERKI